MTDPILVVDDDDALRESLVEALEVLPVAITTAASGAAAVACSANAASRWSSPTSS